MYDPFFYILFGYVTMKWVVKESWNFILDKFMQMVNLVQWWKFTYKTVGQ